MPSDNKVKASSDDKDWMILTFVSGMVYKKLGANAKPEVVQKEVDQLYNKFQDDVFNLAYSQLAPNKQEELNKIVSSGASQQQIQGFVLKEIPNFQKQLEKYINDLYEKYTGEAMPKSDKLPEA